jgi:hypothetical protein
LRDDRLDDLASPLLSSGGGGSRPWFHVLSHGRLELDAEVLSSGRGAYAESSINSRHEHTSVCGGDVCLRPWGAIVIREVLVSSFVASSDEERLVADP